MTSVHVLLLPAMTCPGEPSEMEPCGDGECPGFGFSVAVVKFMITIYFSSKTIQLLATPRVAVNAVCGGQGTRQARSKRCNALENTMFLSIRTRLSNPGSESFSSPQETSMYKTAALLW